MDVQERLDELAVLIEDAKSMPLSASCLVNRAQVLDLIDEIRQLLPESVHRADELLADREAVVQDGRREADRILERARAESDRMVSEHEVYLLLPGGIGRSKLAAAVMRVDNAKSGTARNWKTVLALAELASD